ncbi:MerR family transcriptional regulator [Bogoriella caseilytica]|uniref:MerR-like DNA binding protein n=1 Tax=Bogoriella caseilytica TaxID=56055 RepID=A0A3N2BC38_9MICO|nr:MerR family transcriptional regulator [Bogoriella caseilytica]ROR72826.1 MerR-like DNA binding protein [Bogoriella caseilytica]
MRISELASLTGTSAATIKYYAREGLLPTATRTGYNQTEYGAEHRDRLRLIRALTEVGGLSIASVREVLAAVDDPQMPAAVRMGVAQRAIPRALGEPSTEALGRVHALTESRSWQVDPGNPGFAQAASVLDAYEMLGRGDLGASLASYAQAADQIALADLDAVSASPAPESAAETVVVGTVLGDALIAGLRRIAQEHHARQRFPDSTSHRSP